MQPDDTLDALLETIDRKKAVLDSRRPFDETPVRRLGEYLDVEWTYHSNAIEGNTLTLRETALILNEGITIAGKSMREHLEATNHRTAIHYLHELVEREEAIDENAILKLHDLVMRGIDDQWAGRYRCEDVLLSGSEHEPPSWPDVPRLMAELGSWLASPETDFVPPVVRAARMHFRLVNIHPFRDGNGRTARLAMNLLLMRAGYPITVIRLEDRSKYFDALEHGDATGDMMPFTAFVAEQVERAMDLYLKTLAGINDSNRHEVGL